MDITELLAANLFVGDDDPNSSEFQTLLEVKLPMLQEKTKEHMGGGMLGSISYSMMAFEPLEMTFKLKGYNPRVMSRLSISSPRRTRVTMLGHAMELNSSKEISVKCVVEGRITRMDNSAFQRDGGIEHDYQVNEVVFYALYLDSSEKIYLNLLQGPSGYRIDGATPFANMARSLGLA